MVKVCAVEEFEKLRVLDVRPTAPVPLGVRVIVPVYTLLGVTVKEEEELLTFPEEGPVKLNVEATTTVAFGTTEFEGAEATEVPAELVALTVKV
jgi:hypothetical protein